jgi:NADP-dependent 3-hydroxy acid dehydrogenase YdfG
MPGLLEGRTAAVTGASAGLGAATARALAAQGAAVALGARRRDKLDAVVADIEAAGGAATALEVDLRDPAGPGGFVEGAHAELGGLDVLVNNAGVGHLGPVEDADVAHWREMLDLNVLALALCCRAALPLMREAGGGHIVNVSALAGRRVTAAGIAMYSATKNAVNAFSESLRYEALPHDIRVTVIQPNLARSEGLSAPDVQPAIERLLEPGGRILEAEDIAAGIVYAVTQPAHVDVSEILIRPTRSK